MKPSTTYRIKGELHEIKGKVKQTAGYFMGSPRLRAEGQFEKLAGRVQKRVGQMMRIFE